MSSKIIVSGLPEHTFVAFAGPQSEGTSLQITAGGPFLRLSRGQARELARKLDDIYSAGEMCSYPWCCRQLSANQAIRLQYFINPAGAPLKIDVCFCSLECLYKWHRLLPSPARGPERKTLEELQKQETYTREDLHCIYRLCQDEPTWSKLIPLPSLALFRDTKPTAEDLAWAGRKIEEDSGTPPAAVLPAHLPAGALAAGDHPLGEEARTDQEHEELLQSWNMALKTLCEHVLKCPRCRKALEDGWGAISKVVTDLSPKTALEIVQREISV